MFLLKQSTAVTLKIGPFVDEDDGKTAETGLTISQADVRLSKNGGNIAQKNEGTSCTHDELGIYGCPVDTTDTNTLGRLQLWVHESGALPVWHEFMVVTAHVYDTFCSTDYLQVDVIQVEGSDATDQIRDAVVDDATRIDASALNTLSGNDPGSQLAAQTDVTGLNDPTAVAIRTEIDSNSTQLAAIVADTNELQTDDVPGLIGALNDPTAVAIRTEIDSNSTQLAAIVADTNELQTDDVPGLIGALNDPTAAAIADAVWNETSAGHTDAGKAGQQLWTDVDAILADTNELQTDDVPGLIGALNDPTAVAIRTEIDSNSTQLAAIVADTNELQTDDVPGLIGALNDPTAVAIRTEIDSNSTQLAAIVADTNELQTDDVPGLIGALNDPTAVAIRTEIDSNSTQLAAIVADTNELQTDDVPGLIGALNDPTAATITDAVWDEVLTGATHNIATSAGRRLRQLEATVVLSDGTAQAGGANTITLAADESAVNDWFNHCLCILVAGTGAGQGQSISDYDGSTKVATVSPNWRTQPDNTSEYTIFAFGEVDVYKVESAALNQIRDAILDDATRFSGADIATIVADTNELQTDDVPGLIGALNDVAVTDITQRQIPDSYGADGAQPTIEQALLMIWQFLSERAVSDTTVTVKKPDGSTTAMTLTLDDGTDPTSITRAS